MNNNNALSTLRIALISIALALAGIATPGCEVVGGIFKAGVWVGVILVLLIAAAIAAVAWFVRKRI